MITLLIIPLLIALCLGTFLIYRYNRLVGLRNRFKNSFAQIDVQLKRRYDLIPNLVATAKEYIKHERETLEAVIKARNLAASAADAVARNPDSIEKMIKLSSAESVLGGFLGRFFALAEAYPDLKANQIMAGLMEELTTTENKVAFARQAYNDNVMEYNTSRETFPDLLIASPFGFQEAPLFEVAEAAERCAVKVEF